MLEAALKIKRTSVPWERLLQILGLFALKVRKVARRYCRETSSGPASGLICQDPSIAQADGPVSFLRHLVRNFPGSQNPQEAEWTIIETRRPLRLTHIHQ